MSRLSSAICLVTGGDVRGAIVAFFGFDVLEAFGFTLIGLFRLLILFQCNLLGVLVAAHA